MPRQPIAPFLVALVSSLALGCNGPETTLPTELPAGQPSTGQSPASAAPASGLAAASRVPEFDPGDFVSVVDNRFFPLPPGTRFIYRGSEDGEPLKDIVDVTREAKTILGVKVTVVLDRLFKSGDLVEKTFDYFAQDKAGNVWYFGEDTKEFENGVVVSTAGTFQAGKDGARAGIIMPAHPKVGETTREEFAPGVAEDMATVLSRGEKVSVPFGTFHGCIKTANFTPLEPGAREIKYYCPRIGFVRGFDVTGGTVRLHLTSVQSR